MPQGLIDALQFLGVFFGVQLLFLAVMVVIPAALVIAIARARSASAREPAQRRPEPTQRRPEPLEPSQRYLTDEDVELVAILQSIEDDARR